MKTRAAQRDETRARIIEAALECFSERGFLGASTREIARRAGTNQGLITYHFSSKEELWRAAVDQIFGSLRAYLGEHAVALASEDLRAQARAGIRAYVRFAASHPELFRLMVGEGTCDEPRMQWLVDTHLKPIYDGVARGYDGVPGFDAISNDDLKPHVYYTLAGAASVIFAVAPECRRLTGLDPSTPEAIETHADFVARLLVP